MIRLASDPSVREVPDPCRNALPMARILIIDDEDRLHSLLGIVLCRSGHHPAEARDGDEALRHCAAEPFDAALCDLIVLTKHEHIRESVAYGYRG